MIEFGDERSKTMRDIQFRAWDIENNRMEYVWSIGFKAWDRLGEINYVEIEGDDGTRQVLPDAVHLMQYTGLRDANGVDIYEGDVIEVGDGFPQNTVKGPVVYDEGIWWCDSKPFRRWISGPLFTSNDCVYVVGNIYENPELLEKQK